MGRFFNVLKEEAKNRKNLAGILVLGILILAIPLGIDLIRRQQIFKSRATADPIVFVASNDVFQQDGRWVTRTTTVSMQLTSPLGPAGTPAPAVTPTPAPTPSGPQGTATPAPTPSGPQGTATPAPTPITPTPPSGGTASCQPGGAATFSWSPASKTGVSVTGYTVRINKEPGEDWTPNSGSGDVLVDAGNTTSASAQLTTGNFPDWTVQARFSDSSTSDQIHFGAFVCPAAIVNLIPAKLSTLASLSKNLLSKGLAGTVYAGTCTPGSYRRTCTGSCGGCSADAGEAAVSQCNADGTGYGSSHGECRTECVGPCRSVPNPSGGGDPGGKIGSAADGKGGCCDRGAPDNSDTGCRRDSNPGGFREVCDIANGACVSNTSCRSQTGCALDSDCGPGERCQGGQCQIGAPTGQCQSASSLQARFQLNSTDPWGTSKTTTTGRSINATLFRNGQGVFAGAPVNGVAIRDTIAAKITGPGVNQSIDVSRSNPFTPSQPGTYSLSATCGNNVTSDTATLTVTGGPVVTPTPGPTSGPTPGPTSGPTPGPGCNNDSLTISPNPANVNATMTFQYSSNQSINVSNTWTGGTNGDVTGCQTHLETYNITCTAQSPVSGATWTHYWNNMSCSKTANYTINTSVPSATTVSFRVAENLANLGVGSTVPWQAYTAESMPYDYTFKDTTPGQKVIFVQFKDSAGNIGGCGGNRSQPCQASIKLLGPDPAITSCSLGFEGNNTVLNLTGQNFGSGRGTVKSADTSLTIKSWKNDSVAAVLPSASTEKTVVTLTNSDGQSGDGTCSASSQLALGAKVFCRAPASHQTDNVELVLSGAFEGGAKSRQKVKIDKDGVIQGLTQKLESGKNYKLSLKAPGSLRKTASFTAGDGTTNLPNFILPVGDIFPVDGGDGVINTPDKSELNRQWNIASAVTGRSGDFNQDSRVNSIDWACMRYDFNDSDNPEPVPGGPPAPSPSSSPTPSPSPLPTAIPASTPTPTLLPIAGHVRNSQTQAPIANVPVMVSNDSTSQSQCLSTDGDGYFSVAGLVRPNDHYDVNLPGSPVSSPCLNDPSQFGQPRTPTGYQPPPKTTTPNYAWDYYDSPGHDMPVGSPQYQVQKLGSNDCAGPDDVGRTGRCDFAYDPR